MLTVLPLMEIVPKASVDWTGVTERVGETWVGVDTADGVAAGIAVTEGAGVVGAGVGVDVTVDETLIVVLAEAVPPEPVQERYRVRVFRPFEVMVEAGRENDPEVEGVSHAEGSLTG